ncbi:2'-5'-oligoadenylate synthase 1-like [Alligator sinensis]|uniref:2'-5' oligoadenylate synthase n=2 Tax=Alligator sinensis TaxID=38654 RepID=A0A3Q0GKD2_ALLSI|nr:2'-5'-oligoadenylate synthase 1-like [Alligator sinensis]
MELYQVRARDLDAWIADNLQPSEEFQQQVKDTVRRICDFLKEQCFEDIKVDKTVKGGSAGKGTALKNNSDADLVLFLNCFTSYQDQVEKRASVISTIENQLNRCRQSLAFNIDIEVSQPKGKSTPPRSLCVTIQSKKRRESIEVDVLPAYNALGHVTPGCRPPPQVYVDLIQAGYGPSTFSTTFTELQKNFVKRRPAKLKNLLRLIKHWYKKYLLESYTLSVLPTKYALELLTIYAWESGTERAERFSTAEGFCTVMELLCRYQELCVYWTEFYDFQHPVVGAHIKQQLRNQRPVILDPADPTGLLGQGKKWELVAREASKCRSQLCFQNGTTPIQPWPVQPARPVQVRVKQLSGSWLDLTRSPSTTIQQIKGEIERLWHIPPYQQRLALQDTDLDSQKVLDDNGTLASHGIFYDVTILLLQTQPQEMEIFVKGHDGRTYTFGARPTDTVQNLKAKIQAKLKVPVDQQRLTHNSQELEDRHPLTYYHIENHSTIYLLLRLRGGCRSPRALSPPLATVL